MKKETNYDKLADELCAKKLEEYKVEMIAHFKNEIRHLRDECSKRQGTIEMRIEEIKKLEHIPGGEGAGSYFLN